MAIVTSEMPLQEVRAPIAPAEIPRYRFSTTEYLRLAESGILGEDDRVELIDGDIIVMSPIGSRHHGNVDHLAELLVVGLVGRAIVHVQNPIRLDDYTEPQPDFALLRPRADYYRSNTPTPADVLLVIEVMDSSAAYDRGTKLKLYARAGIPEVWLVDLNEEWVEVYRRPSGDMYTHRLIRQRGESVSPEAFPDFVLAVDDILG